MSDFISEHMQQILQPFAEHVDELHRSIDILEGDLRSTTDTANANKAQLATHVPLLSGLRMDLDGTTRRGHATQSSLDKTIKEKALLEADHQKSKARLSASEEKIRILFANVETLQHSTQELRLGLDKVTTAHAATETNLVRNCYPALFKLEADVVAMTKAQVATAELLASTKTFAVASDRDQKVFAKKTESQWKEDEDAFAHVNKMIADITVTLRENTDRLETHSEHLKTTNARTRPHLIRIEKLEGLYKVVGGQRAETIRDVAEMHERLTVHKTMIDKLVGKFGDDDPKKGRGIFETLQKVSEQLTKHSMHIDRIDTITRNTNKKLEEVDNRGVDQECRNEDLTHRTVKIEDTLGVEHHTFDGGSMPSSPMAGGGMRSISGETGRQSTLSPMLGRQSMARQSTLSPRARTTSHNIQMGMGMPLSVERNAKEWSIAHGQKAGMRRIDATASAVAKTHAKLELSIMESSETEARVQALEDELGMTNDMVAKLSASLDLKQEYWEGLGKGLRNVHKAVAVDGDMLPLKSNLAQTLPALGKTPRLISTSPDDFSKTL